MPLTAQAQVSFGGVPAAEWAELSPLVPTVTTDVPDVVALMAEDEARNHRPLRYGELVDAELDIAASGAWDITPDGTTVWRQRFEAPGALTVALEFTRFDLPEGAQMFVYDDELTQVLGAYTHRNHQENGGFVFTPLEGDHLILEYVQPSFVEGSPAITVDKLIYDYRGVYDLERQLDTAGGEEVAFGSCLVDANCPAGDNYELQKRATMRTLSGGGLCSAALINNTAEDETQYVLTADHCGQSGNTVFRFNYKNATCGGGGAPTSQQVSGATVLTTSPTYDCRLMRINGNIPSSYSPYYAGWTRSSFNTSFAVALGHPGGGPMTISVDNNGTSKESTLWRVFWNSGILQGGNSGGPLIDVNGRVKGPACCVSNFSCGSQTAWFGRFDRFYDTNNLAQWLDPAGSNPQTLDGFDPSNPGGGPGVAPVISTVSPSTLPALFEEGAQTVTLTGSDFTSTFEVQVNGQVLETFPPEWILVDDSNLTVQVSPQDTLGPIDIRVTNTFGSTTTQVTIDPVSAPVVDLVGSDPGFLFTATGLIIRSASEVNDLVYVIGSLSNVPTVLPGLVSLDLGNNGLAINILNILNVDPVKGWNEINVPVAGVGLGTGSKVYVQLAVISALSPSLPALTSNLQSGTVLF